MSHVLLLKDVNFVLLDEKQTLSLCRAQLTNCKLPRGSHTGRGAPGKRLCLYFALLGFTSEVGLKGLHSVKRKVHWA